MPLRILVADDQEMIRRGLKSLLETHTDWQIAGEAKSGLEALRKTTELEPDVVVLDISMPGLNGLEVSRRIHEVLPQVEVLFLTVHDSQQIIREALDAGGRGYVLKCDGETDLLAAVESVAQHKFFFSPKINGMLHPMSDNKAQPQPRPLDSRAQMIIPRWG